MAKTYELLPEHRAQLHSWHRKWVSIAMRTEPQTSADRSAMIEAINGLYDAASIPRPRHIVFAPSPLAGQIAAGFAAAIWHLRDHPEAAEAAAQWHAAKAATMHMMEDSTAMLATYPATEAAITDAALAATKDATFDVTLAATEAATFDATATKDATTDAARNPTLDTTEAVARVATSSAIVGATEAAVRGTMRDWRAAMHTAFAVFAVAAMWAAVLATMGDAMGAATWVVFLAATGATTLVAILHDRQAAADVTWEAATWKATEAATWPATLAAKSDATLAAKSDATVAAMCESTEAATWTATKAATEDATWDAMMDATWDAMWEAVMDATRAATWDATRAATWEATRAATGRATRGATREAWARRLATLLMPTTPDVLCACAVGALRMCNEGNMSADGAGVMSCLGADVISSFRHVVKLPLDYSKWHHYEEAAIHGGWRFMHPKFCIVVDFPERLLIDAQNRPHCADGPSHRWRDGYQIFHWHGLRIDPAHEWIVTDKAKITKHAILTEPNSELRRAMCEIAGWNNAIAMLGGKIVSRDEIHGQRRELLDIDLGNGETARLIRLANGTAEADGTRRQFIEGVPPDVATPHDAEAWQYGISAQWYKEACRS